ncbi:DEAD/DEAH box helicase [Mesosutterella sp. AGMB02718]|uniref:DEAD/DEAH box helicase n=1 Tax=Mesosutterella faecium TaxID=2925194 RepID=A0ABT7IKH5_9BURK|nr:DEAD/DEAH box helicase [Mesosutterella sp. AGMB02718]MDL2058485.1 DEAD/DEAH box helicase [Mesosutterella sp. AGMB02718]
MTEPQDFSSFQLDPRILAAISEVGYVKPTPIQQKAIPVVLAGQDVMGAAQTGTGKTAGYGLPLLQRILPHENSSASPARHPVRALILAPTRELADQVNENLKAYASKTRLRVGVVFGGVDIRPQSEMLRRGVEVLTATPGRLLDHIEQKATNLSQVEIVVLDEADRMLDMGFLPDISRILQLIPKGVQSLMFSATFSPEIKKLARQFLKTPILIEVARQNAAADTITQQWFVVRDTEKSAALIQLLRTGGEDGAALRQVLVFVNSKLVCRRLTRLLVNAGIAADSIHGDKTQEERLKALEGFKSGATHVLVATDVAARGLDIAELPVVINFDVPFAAEDYVHRIGRTGRAGSKGLAITLATREDEKQLAAIEELIKKKVERQALAVHREPREGARVHRRSGRACTYTPPAPPADPIFDHPYEPSAPAAVRPGAEPAPRGRSLSGLAGGSRLAPHRSAVCALLGGGFRRNSR